VAGKPVTVAELRLIPPVTCAPLVVTSRMRSVTELLLDTELTSRFPLDIRSRPRVFARPTASKLRTGVGVPVAPAS
jgi:hypothetical protein